MKDDHFISDNEFIQVKTVEGIPYLLNLAQVCYIRPKNAKIYMPNNNHLELDTESISKVLKALGFNWEEEQ